MPEYKTTVVVGPTGVMRIRRVAVESRGSPVPPKGKYRGWGEVPGETRDEFEERTQAMLESGDAFERLEALLYEAEVVFGEVS